MSDNGRSRGILTSADREFLRSEPDEYSRQARHARKEAIVDRMRNAMLDFTLLFEYLDEEDGWVDVFDPDKYTVDEWSGATGYPERTTPEGDDRRDRTPNPPPDDLEDLFEDRPELTDVDPETGQIQLKSPEDRLIGVYEGMVDVLALLFKTFYERDNVAYPSDHVGMLIEAALRRLLAERGEELYDFEFGYNTEPVDVEELRDRFLDGEKLTYGEFEVLRREGQFLDGQGRSVDPAVWVNVQYGFSGTDDPDESD